MTDERGGRYFREARFFLAGDKVAAQSHILEARSLMGHMRDIHALGGPPIQVEYATLQDGTKIKASMLNGQYQAEIVSPRQVNTTNTPHCKTVLVKSIIAGRYTTAAVKNCTELLDYAENTPSGHYYWVGDDGTMLFLKQPDIEYPTYRSGDVWMSGVGKLCSMTVDIGEFSGFTKYGGRVYVLTTRIGVGTPTPRSFDVYEIRDGSLVRVFEGAVLGYDNDLGYGAILDEIVVFSGSGSTGVTVLNTQVVNGLQELYRIDFSGGEYGPVQITESRISSIGGSDLGYWTSEVWTTPDPGGVLGIPLPRIDSHSPVDGCLDYSHCSSSMSRLAYKVGFYDGELNALVVEKYWFFSEYGAGADYGHTETKVYVMGSDFVLTSFRVDYIVNIGVSSGGGGVYVMDAHIGSGSYSYVQSGGITDVTVINPNDYTQSTIRATDSYILCLATGNSSAQLQAIALPGLSSDLSYDPFEFNPPWAPRNLSIIRVQGVPVCAGTGVGHAALFFSELPDVNSWHSDTNIMLGCGGAITDVTYQLTGIAAGGSTSPFSNFGVTYPGAIWP